MSPKRTEADLCSAFIDALEPGWTVYPETAGWDILLALEQRRPSTATEARAEKWTHRCTHPLEPGTQLGIEAKLRGNCTVLRQALPGLSWCDIDEQPGPDFRAVLVPRASPDFGTIAAALGLIVIEGEPGRNAHLGPVAGHLESMLRHRPVWDHSRRHKLPEVVPDVPAGVPSPSTLSRWKIQAVRLCVLLRDRGFLTHVDFKQHGVSTTRWYHNWIVKGDKVGRIQRWVARPGWVPWDETHAGVAAQLREKDAKATA